MATQVLRGHPHPLRGSWSDPCVSRSLPTSFHGHSHILLKASHGPYRLVFGATSPGWTHVLMSGNGTATGVFEAAL